METLDCGHVAAVGASRMCRHLVDPANDSPRHARLLRGHGLDHDLCCVPCDNAMQAGQVIDLIPECEGCVARIADEMDELAAWRGEPGIVERPEPVDTTLTETALPADMGAVVDLAPATATDSPLWMLLTDDGEIGRLDATTGAWHVLAHHSVDAEPDHEPWAGHGLRQRLHVDPTGEFAAVVNDHGHHGQVIHLPTGRVTMTLHGGEYRPDTVPFSYCFAMHDGRTVAVHRTDWNRLDVCDAATGDLLTVRGPTSFTHGEAEPDHYLDYFHGEIHLSPSGRRIADDGWVWSPTGIPRAWDLRRWLGGNPWESEDGDSVRHLCLRHYHWNSPMCWITDDLLAVSGIGPDDELMVTGVRVFDVVSGTEVSTFAGPAGALFSDGARLYSAGPGGLDIWDPYTGHRTGTVTDFAPTSHHRGTHELAMTDGRTLRRWRIPAAHR